MSSINSSLSPSQSIHGKSRQRPLEIDRFVDHFLSTMCDHSRRQIMELLALPHGEETPSETTSIVELRSGDIAKKLGLSPATVSGHLRQLSNAGLLVSRREGNVIYYRVSNYLLVRAFQELLTALHKEYDLRSAAS